MLPDYAQKFGTIARQFALPHTAHAQHLLFVERLQSHHVQQRGVMENHIGRHVMFFRQALAALSQRFPEPFVFRVTQLFSQTGRSAAAGHGLLYIFTQPYDLLAAQYRPRPLSQIQAAKAGMINPKLATRHQLAEHRLPLCLAQITTNAEGAELVVAVLQNSLILNAIQHINQVADAKALPGAIDAG